MQCNIIPHRKKYKEPLFSIIIPAYNADGKIQKALDSIYSQGISDELFEVVCVDDCSPNPSSAKCIRDYINLHNKANIKLVVHKDNRRQGGARNTGVMHTDSKYVMFIDQDDYFADGAFKEVVKQLSNCNLDMVMWDHTFHKYGKVTPRLYAANHDRIVDGMSFILENEYTWAPWGYSYRREFLLENNLKFVECVQFEDADFVSLCISKAKKIRYNPISLIHYTVNPDSQTNIGSETKQKMDFLFQIGNRMLDVAERIRKENEAAGDKVYSLGELCKYVAIKRLIQYKSHRGRYDLIKKHVAGQHNNTSNRVLRFASKYPRFFTLCLNMSSLMLRAINRMNVKMTMKYANNCNVK